MYHMIYESLCVNTWRTQDGPVCLHGRSDTLRTKPKELYNADRLLLEFFESVILEELWFLWRVFCFVPEVWMLFLYELNQAINNPQSDLVQRFYPSGWDQLARFEWNYLKEKKHKKLNYSMQQLAIEMWWL